MLAQILMEKLHDLSSIAIDIVKDFELFYRTTYYDQGVERILLYGSDRETREALRLEIIKHLNVEAFVNTMDDLGVRDDSVFIGHSEPRVHYIDVFHFTDNEKFVRKKDINL